MARERGEVTESTKKSPLRLSTCITGLSLAGFWVKREPMWLLAPRALGTQARSRSVWDEIRRGSMVVSRAPGPGLS